MQSFLFTSRGCLYYSSRFYSENAVLIYIPILIKFNLITNLLSNSLISVSLSDREHLIKL